MALVIYLHSASSTFFIKPKNIQNLLFIYLNISLAIWTFSFMLFFSSSDKNLAMIWFRIAAIGYCTYYAFALHFTLIVLMKGISYTNKVALGLVYLTCIPFIYLFFTNDLSFITLYTNRGLWFLATSHMEPWYIMYLIVSVLPLLITLYPCYNCVKKTVSKRTKKKYKIIFITQLITQLLGVSSKYLRYATI